MPTGLFRTTDQSAQVEYDSVSIPIPSLGRRTKRTPTSLISTNCPSKTNTRRHKRSCAMPKGLKSAHLAQDTGDHVSQIRSQ
jgi:hypothetical protein